MLPPRTDLAYEVLRWEAKDENKCSQLVVAWTTLHQIQNKTSTSIPMVIQSNSSKSPIKTSTESRLLLRSSWGASLPSNVPDDSLDDEIAKILLKEAKEKESRWNATSSIGFSSFLKRDESESKTGPRQTNKRFLKSVIRDVNDHNRSLLHKNSDHNSIENSEQEHQRLRDSGRIQQWDKRPSSPRSSSRNDAPHRSQTTVSTTKGDRSSGKVRGVDLERLILQGGRSSKGKERAIRSEEDVDVDEQEEMRRLRATKRGGHRDDREKALRRELLKARDPTLPTSQTNRPTSVLGQKEDPQETNGLEASSSTVAQPSSKMDKYFSPAYDPRLDISLEELTDNKTGLIAEGVYDDWDQILKQFKDQKEQKRREKERESEERRERKERRRKRREERTRRRREREKQEGGSDSDEHPKKSRRSRAYTDACEEEEDYKSRRSRRKRVKRSSSHSSSSESSDQNIYKTTHAQRTARKELGLMDIDGYAKRGKIREWDLGKENPT
ncbi:uncharacterized protein MELLADRAFT_118120 [Melampsora larici-populina 98AG31]|uniref:Uncharacterized protein n=1 Tax=Melampsora larici-populina (strain 98AG31 / pathotype 3-4-7) TaxID=747676 RepID=F4S5A4_MELLP|nr:uncharacterized protein MELLADRAFT_118120 [Melampsora larici-populina 98AG31]EGG00194.1 hypothetical protein MELLADRAFT_118120 [Melampsora larici-populina 98AG31]